MRCECGYQQAPRHPSSYKYCPIDGKLLTLEDKNE